MATKIAAKGHATFICTVNPQAKTVFLAGSFNDWDPMARPMRRSKDGSFRASMDLPTGEYQYKFVVDGEWHADPDAAQHTPDTFGGANSVVCVS